MHYSFVKKQNLYKKNDLAFKSTQEILQSTLINEILPPALSFLDKNNKNANKMYNYYLKGANFVSYPYITLKSVLGLTTKEEPKLNVPEKIKNIQFYATEEGTDIQSIQNTIIEKIFKFGAAGIHIEIPENTSIIDTLPHFKVYGADKIVDYFTIKNKNGLETFKFVVLDTSKYIFNFQTNYHEYKKLYKILGLNAEGVYYEVIIKQSEFSTFNFDYPEKTVYEKLSYPTWISNLDFVPFVAITKSSLKMEYTDSFIQSIIDLSYENFQLNSELHWLYTNCKNSVGVVKSENIPDGQEFPIGPGAIWLVGQSDSAEFITPSTTGMTEIREKIAQNDALIAGMMYDLLNASASASGDALFLRISVKVADLVNLVKTVGKGITIALEFLDKIVENNDANKDFIDYFPYLDFGNAAEYLQKIEEKTIIQSEENKETLQ